MHEKSEAIQMLERQFNLFPARFAWRGQIYDVDAVNECKTVTSRSAAQGMHHFWIRSNGQMLHLCEIFPRSEWLIYRETTE